MTLDSWVIAAVAASILGVLGFLIRHSFEGVQRGLGELGGKMDSLSKDMASSNVHAATFEADVKGELRALRDRMDRLERDVREMSEGGVAR